MQTEPEEFDTGLDEEYDDLDPDWDPSEDFELAFTPPDDTSPGVDPALASAVNAIGPDFPSAIAAHIASGGTAPAVEFPLDGPWIARTGPHCALGRWVTYTDQEGVQRRRWESITTWIAYREVERLVHGIGRDNRLTEPLDARHDVRILDATGIRPEGWLAKDVPLTASGNVIAVHDLARARLMLPSSTTHLRVAGSMMRVLGRTSLRVERTIAGTGWVLGLDPDHPNAVTFVAPNGSITAEGVTTDYQVVPPIGSTGDLPASMALVGFTGATAPVDQSVEALRRFLAITENRTITIGLLGALFSAPLNLAARPVVMVAGRTDSGKTMLAAAAMRFLADIADPDDAPLFGFAGTSEAGARARLSWARDLAVLADDYRHDGSSGRRANEAADQLLTTLTQAGARGGGSAKGTRDGGARTPAAIRSTIIVTAETASVEPAIRNRTVVIEVGPSDGIVNPGFAYDEFQDLDNTLPRSLMAAYLRWLAGRIDARSDDPGGGLTALTHRANADARAWRRQAGMGRAAIAVGGLHAGWRMFRRFARAAGIEEALPSADEVEDALRSLADVNALAARSLDPAARLIETLADSVRSGAGHLVSTDGHEPEVPAATGWTLRVTEGQHFNETRIPNGPEVGVVARDKKTVFLTRLHVQAVAKLAHLDGLTPGQLHAGLEAVHVGKTHPGDRVPESAVPGRPKGWLVPIGRVLAGLGDDEEPETTRQSEDEDECY